MLKEACTSASFEGCSRPSACSIAWYCRLVAESNSFETGSSGSWSC